MITGDFLPPEWKPHSYQQRGIDWLITHPAGALFFAPGLGKTSTTLAAFMRLRELGYDYKMLILAPLRVCQSVWTREHLKWLQFSGLKVGLAHGTDKKTILLDPFYDVVILNYDGIQWAAPLLFKHNPFAILAADELTRLKHTTTRRFKALKPILPTFTFRWGLTGSPAANNLVDIFGQMFVLDLGYRFGKYITHFKARYFHQKPYDPWGWYITPEKADQIATRVKEVAMYVDPEEVLKLPPVNHVELNVTLPAAVMKQYKELKLLAITQLTSESVVTAVSAGVATNKLRQLVGGAIYIEGVTEEVHSAKLDALADLVEELNGQPLMVTYTFTHELERIQKLFPVSGAIRGGMSGQQVEAIIAAWDGGDLPLLCVQTTAGAHGLNLQFGGSKLCWFSQTFNLEEYIQLNARLHRQGQTDPVMIYHILAENTIDQHIRKVLKSKDATQADLFSALVL